MKDCIIPQGYKATPLGIIPQEWEVKFLGDLLSRCANGLTYDISITSGIPVTRIETISTGKINYMKVGYIPDGSGYEPFLMQKGDILYSHINSLSQIGKVAYYNGDKKIYHGMNLLLLRANNCLDKQYLYYILLTEHMRHVAQVIAKPAVNQASISISDLKRIKVPVPPLAEQKKIAEVLDVWDKAINKQSQLIEQLTLRKHGLMQQLLTAKRRLPGFSGPWKKVKLGDIARCFSGGTPKAGSNEYYDGNIPFIRSGEIHQKNTELFLSKLGMAKSSAKMVQKGDLLMALYGANSGDSAVSQIDGAINQAILCIRPRKVLVPFLCPFLNLNKDMYIAKYLQGGQGNLSGEIVLNYKIPIPPLAEQTAIAEVLTSADREIELAQQKLKLLRQQKHGLMQQLLTGKKRVKY